MAIILVKCTNPLCLFRFPVNLKKHLNRRERFCPRCHTKTNVRPKLWFSPNPKWSQQREEAEANRQLMRAKKGKGERGGPPIVPQELPRGLLALSLLLKKQAEEEKKQQ